MYCNKALFEVSAILFTQKYLSAQDFHFINEATKRTSPKFPYWKYENIDIQLQHMNDDECLAEFMVNRSELNAVAKAMMVPGQFRFPNGTIASGFEGLCIVLRRFAYPCRFVDMIHRFARSVPELSLISSEVIDFIYATHGYLLRTLNQPWLSPHCLEEFANPVHQRGAALTSCSVLYMALSDRFLVLANTSELLITVTNESMHLSSSGSLLQMDSLQIFMDQ